MLEGLGVTRQRALSKLGTGGASRPWSFFRPLFRKAQKRLEKKHRRQRLDLMNYDKHRQEMLQDLGEVAAARRIKKAIEAVLSDGQVRTADLGGTATTTAFTQAIVARM